MPPLPDCDPKVCPLLIAAQLLTEAAAEQAGFYAHGGLGAVDDVATLAQLHARLRLQVCPATATQRGCRRSRWRRLEGALTPARAARMAVASCPAWQ